MSGILRVEHLKKKYGTEENSQNGIDDISFEILEGEFVSIMGASGSGKTTLLNCISTIDFATAGHIFIRDHEVGTLSDKEMAQYRRENLGFIFQDFNLLDTLTVGENISLALTINHVSTKEINIKLAEVSDKLGITNLLNKYPYEISGGEKQRCACARAIVNKPDLILADEPTGSLDSSSSKTLMELLEFINKSQNATIILVTHDVFVAAHAHRIIFLKDGRICDSLVKDKLTRNEYLNRIVEKVSVLGGEGACILN